MIILRPAGRGMLVVLSLLSQSIVQIFTLIGTLIAKISWGSGRCLKLMLKPLKFVGLGYFGAFASLYEVSRSFGILGELLFTVIGLGLLLWPMVIPHYAEN